MLTSFMERLDLGYQFYVQFFLQIFVIVFPTGPQWRIKHRPLPGSAQHKVYRSILLATFLVRCLLPRVDSDYSDLGSCEKLEITIVFTFYFLNFLKRDIYGNKFSNDPFSVNQFSCLSDS